MADVDGASLGPYRDRLTAVDGQRRRLAEEPDARLTERARALAAAARDGRPPAELEPELFGLSGEAAHRALGLDPYPEQVAAGLAMADGRVAEMATGEGKTLAAVAPVALHALAGRGAHVLTANDYLAGRDAGWMGPVYRLLGLTVGAVADGEPAPARRRAYAADVTYLTAREAGFDLLRDGLALEPGERVQRALHSALVDEADSILVDEARIPLVIAGAREGEAPAGRIAEVVAGLEPGVHFDTDAHERNVALTEAGAERVEAALACGDLFAPDRAGLHAAVRHALHARCLTTRDVDYIVRDGAVELVDELTGRVAERRRWPDGLQAAVEAKEGLDRGEGGVLLGSITMCHLLRLYPHRAGMTATARPAADELDELYGLEVAAIPPHRRSIRMDEPDLVFTHREARDRALARKIERVHATGRPILVGTASVADSERVAALLARRGVAGRVLNARHHAEEAAIVADAGAPGAVTISTNMAGRGTDIRLGGRDGRHRAEVAARGGLLVLGTHRHESRRVDDQLRGRAGRQGDPGSSRFYVSLDDPLLRRFGLAGLVPAKLFPDRCDEPIDSAVVRREIERTQRIAEGWCADARRRLIAYADILETQRRDLAAWRRAVLEGRDAPGLIARRRPERWRRLARRLPTPDLAAVERRLTLLAIDRAWSDYLTEMEAERDEMHLVTLDGRQPVAEYYRTALAAWEPLHEQIDGTVLDLFDDLEIGPDGVDWRAAALTGPAATWTYLVDDDVFSDNLMLGLSTRASLGFAGVLAAGPVLLAWGLWQHWRRWRERRRAR